MGVYPYITAQIILQLLVPIIPALEQRMKENPREGQIWMEKWTMILTIPMALLSAIGQINIFAPAGWNQPVLLHYGFTGANLLPTVTTIVTMVAGTMFGIWLGQLISEYGIPNQGLSLIIFAGIVSRMPSQPGFAPERPGQRLVDADHDPASCWPDHLRDRLCPARPAQCAGALPRTARGQPHVDAGAQQPAPDGQYGRHDPTDLCPVHSDLPGDRGQLFHQLTDRTGWRILRNGIYTHFQRPERLATRLIYFFMVVAFTFFYTDVLVPTAELW